MPVKPIPDGYHSVTPYLIITEAVKALDFYRRAFGATELFRLTDANGRIGHAEIKIGDSPIMLADEMPEMKYLSPKSLGGTPVSILLYVENVDAVFATAITAGAVVTRPVMDQFYGDRSGTLTDPFGHVWTLATHIQDVSHEEMTRRIAALSKPKS